LVAILTILVTTDYEYLTIFKDVPRFNKVEIDYKYFTIMKDVPGSRLYPSISFYYEYLTILEDSDSDEKDYNADKITASDEKDYSADKITDSNEEDYKFQADSAQIDLDITKC
ncbi:45739_t:CDS:2, partial [Gigaspora margarita]